ncbi:PP2C family protein-serine/threonine phosphatase [Nocardioides caeni]|uniref:Serine/threonine-protein phosphatase n=1 Tax=Nocardioides caeni TaxID=574700 RepID=A0A4S8NMU4_9ACTN|nr:protein phosphatase 2C domain-containing protein [Nocardioides caeni]THV18270.1 serine/threonine-protein phosphatase [Nocardioides caeni]
MVHFRVAALSDTGPVREINEDSAIAGPRLLGVADGVGGAAAGELASATTACVLDARAQAHPGLAPDRLLRTAIAEAQRMLATAVRADASRAGMATTLTAILTDGEHTAIAQVGDSRAYLLRDGRLAPLTRDQTMVQSLVDAGRMTPEEAATSPYRHVVLQAVDGEHPSDPVVTSLDLHPGDRLLLCSDGLTDVLSPAALQMVMGLESRATVAERLVRGALDAGTRDNVTVVVADVVDGPPAPGRGAQVGAVVDPANIIAPAPYLGLRTA